MSKRINKIIDKAVKEKHKLVKIHELSAGKWIIGWELVKELRSSKFDGNTIDDETFLDLPYLLDYKTKDSLYLAIEILDQ